MNDFLCLHIGWDCHLQIVQTHKHANGVIQQPAWRVTRPGKGLGYERLQDHFTNLPAPPPEDVKLDHSTLVIPCTRRVTERILNFLDTQRLMSRSSDDYPAEKPYGPYHFTVSMTGEEEFEGTGRRDVRLIGGPETAYRNRLKDLWAHNTINAIMPWRGHTVGHKNPENIPYARYNCWTATQGLTQYIGGIDMAGIHPQFTTAYRAAAAQQRFSLLFTRLQRFWSGQYDVQVVDKNTLVARRGDNPPFIMSAHSCTLGELLDKRTAYGTGDSIAAYISRFAPFDVKASPAMKGPAP